MNTFYFDVYVDEFRPSRRLYYDGVFNGNPKEGVHEMAYCEADGPKPARVIGCHPPGDQIAHRDRVIYVDAENVTSSAVHRATYKYTSYVRSLGETSTTTVEKVVDAHPPSAFFMESCSDILIREADRLKRKLEEYMEEDRKEIKYLKALEKKLQAKKKFKYGAPAAKKIKREPDDAVQPGTSRITFEAVVDIESVLGIDNIHVPLHEQLCRTVARTSRP